MSEPRHDEICTTCGRRYGKHFGTHCDWPLTSRVFMSTSTLQSELASVTADRDRLAAQLGVIQQRCQDLVIDWRERATTSLSADLIREQCADELEVIIGPTAVSGEPT